MDRLKVLASGLFFFSYLLIQTLAPIYAQWSQQWLDLGWTMYTGLREEPAFTVIFHDGTTETLAQIQRQRKVGIVVGGKVDTARFVPPHLCEELPTAESVVIRYPRSNSEKVYPCSR